MNKTISRLLASQDGIPIRSVWLALPLAISFIAMNFTPLKEGDLWWHLKVGKLILQEQHILQVDEFTYTAFQQPYLFSHSWLSDVILHFGERVGGLPLLVLGQSLVATIIAGLILYESLRRGASPPLAATLTLASWAGIFPYSSIRPQIFSFLSFAIFCVLCSGYVQRKVNHLWLLPPIMLLWVNLHGAWVMGLVLWAVYLGGARLQSCWDPDQVASPRPLFISGLVSLLLLPLNPEGLAVYRSLLSAGSNIINQQFVSEWQPLVITNPLAWAFFGLLALWIMGLAYTSTRPGGHEVLLILTFAAFGLRYLRMLPFFFIVAAPIIAQTLAGIRLDGMRNRFPYLLATKTEPRPVNSLINGAFLMILVAIALFSVPALRIKLTNRSVNSLVSANFPIVAVDRLEQEAPAGARLYTLAEWGGYLIWRFYPKGLVFADGRVELFTTEIWNDYITLSTGAAGWDKLVDRYQIDYLVASKDRQAGLILNAYQQGWSCLSEDGVAIVLSRQPANGSCPSLESRKTP